MVLVTLPQLQKSDNRQISKLFLVFAVFLLDWQSVAEREKFADAVLICTPDSLHKVNICVMWIFCIFVFSALSGQKLVLLPRNLRWLLQGRATTSCWRNQWP